MDSPGDQAIAVAGTVHAATMGVQRGMAAFGAKTVAGTLLNATTLGALATYTLWSELYKAVTSDAPVHNTVDAIEEMFDPIHILLTRGAHFYESMQDFQFEEAGEDLGEMEVVGAAMIDGSVPEMEGAATAATEAEIAAGGTGRAKVSTLEPGPYAKESIPARGTGRDFTGAERDAIDALGRANGCHTCGTKDPGTQTGHFIPDHQPPNALAEGRPQQLYPHCNNCRRVQGGQVTAALRKNP
jgi:hypothetical protein